MLVPSTGPTAPHLLRTSWSQGVEAELQVNKIPLKPDQHNVLRDAIKHPECPSELSMLADQQVCHPWMPSLLSTDADPGHSADHGEPRL